jgi:hypothetical protein
MFASQADTSSVIDYIYNYDFIKAKSQLNELYTGNPLISETLNLEINWWMAIESGEKDQFSDFLIKLNQFEKCRKDDLSSIISLTYRMRYFACIKKNCLLPVLYLKILNHMENIDISELEYSNHEGYELFNLYKSFFNLIQFRYSLENFFTGSQKKQLFIGDIENVVLYGSSPNRTIGRYLLMKYYLDIEKDKPKAISYLAELHKQYPKNKIFTQLLTN